MKKLLIVSTIIAIMCVCLVGCIDNDKPVEITATATTVQSIGEVKASDYNDGYHSDDYFIEVTVGSHKTDKGTVARQDCVPYELCAERERFCFEHRDGQRRV